MTAKLCARPGCTESVFSWLDKEHCTAECEAEDRKVRKQREYAELVRDIDAILAAAYAADSERKAA